MIITDFFKEIPDEITLTVSSVSGGTDSTECAVLNREHSLTLSWEQTRLHRFTCSPADLGALCTGWLFTEGYKGASAIEISADGLTATVHGTSPFPVQPTPVCPSRDICPSPQEMLALFRASSDKHARSHGIHVCVIKADGWQTVGTDIGRHNAIDKAVGAAILAGHTLCGAVMFSSGRINTQTVQKAVRCKLGCLMSKATITHDALLLARDLGLKVLFSVSENGYFSI